VLDVLHEHRRTATFFVLVDRAEAAPDLLRRMRDEGHEIALHGLDHRRLTRMARGDVFDTIVQARRRLGELAGVPIRWFRPPYGSQSVFTYLAARRAGLDVVVWSADCADWTETTEGAIADLAAARLHPGGILLTHDSLDRDPEEKAPSSDDVVDRGRMTDALIRRLDRRGLSPMTVGELLERGRTVRTAWFRP
jgi:peptidoglycan/xylan/chitin deacetylase (PgdA/CDA1 family)